MKLNDRGLLAKTFMLESREHRKGNFFPIAKVVRMRMYTYFGDFCYSYLSESVVKVPSRTFSAPPDKEEGKTLEKRTTIAFKPGTHVEVNTPRRFILLKIKDKN